MAWNSTKEEECDSQCCQQSTNPIQRKSLESCIRSRHSCRVFKTNPVPTHLLRYCAQLAQMAPSNSNIQNWRLRIASGAARDRVVAQLKAASLLSEPVLPKLPAQYQQYRDDLVNLVYGEQGYDVMGEARREVRQAKRLLQYEFFKAPACAVVTMDRDLGVMDAMSVGMFVQTFILALTRQGVGSCLQVSVTGFPEALRTGFELEDDQQILCGIAIGWPDEKHPVNALRVKRDDVEKQVTFLN